MRILTPGLALVASALTATACSAQDAPAAAATQTRAEAIAQADARFAQIDTNHDGLVSPTEMQAYRSALRDRMIARGGDAPAPSPGGGPRDGMGSAMGPGRMDRDSQGSVTKAEFEARAGQRFDRMDTNHDGTIDATERANRAEMRRVDRRERRERRDGTRPAVPASAQAAQ